MRRTLIILGVLVLSLTMISGVGATGLLDWQPPWVEDIPELEPQPWADGQYATYNIAITVEGETISGDLRFALVGKEDVAGEGHYWFEANVFNIGDLPEDIGDDDFEKFSIKLLMKEYDMSSMKDDPEAFLEDLFAM